MKIFLRKIFVILRNVLYLQVIMAYQTKNIKRKTFDLNLIFKDL